MVAVLVRDGQLERCVGAAGVCCRGLVSDLIDGLMHDLSSTHMDSGGPPD